MHKIKRWLWRSLALLLMILVGGFGAYWFKKSATAEQGEVEVVKSITFMPEKTALGDKVTAICQLSIPWGQKLVGVIPEYKEGNGTFMVGEPGIKSDYFHWGYVDKTVEITLVPYRTGELELGEVNFQYERPQATMELSPAVQNMAFPTLTVAELAVDKTAELPLAGELSIAELNYRYLFFAFLIIIISGMIMLVIYKLIKRKAVEILAPPTAWQVALNELAKLRLESKDGNFNYTYTRLSDILRRYLEKRFLLPATISTTPEFLHTLRFSDVVLNDAQKQSLSEFMEAADLVKFAKMQPGEAAVANAITKAETLIKETIPAAAPDKEVKNV